MLRQYTYPTCIYVTLPNTKKGTGYKITFLQQNKWHHYVIFW